MIAALLAAVPWPNFTWDVNLGQLLVVGAVSAIGYGVRQIYTFVKKEVARVKIFIARVDDNDQLLAATTAVVDDHTRVLIQHGLLPPPIVRLQRGRRVSDPPVFTREDLS